MAMIKADEFRAKARDYFDQAQGSRNQWIKSLLLMIADDYLNMAIQSETATVQAQYPKADQDHAA
jgi:hypothetical protein